MSFGHRLVELAESRPDVVVLSPDVARYTDLAGFIERFPSRFFQTGMAEQNTIGVAAGLAKAGLRPVVVGFGVFLTRRALDQVQMALATGGPRVTMVGFMPGITTPFRATHQATDDIALLRGVPKMHVVDPADRVDLESALEWAIDGDPSSGPVYIRSFFHEPPPLVEGDRPFDPDRAQVIRAGRSSVGVIGTGLGTQWAMEAARILEAEGIDLPVLHAPVLVPLDRQGVTEFCRSHDAILCVENHLMCGGLFSSVAELMIGEPERPRIAAAGIPNAWPPSGGLDYLRTVLGLDAASLAQRVRDLLATRTKAGAS